MKAWQAYRSLTAEQKQILSARELDVKRAPGDLIALLGPLATWDQVLAELRRRFGIGAVIGLIASFLLLVTGVGILLLPVAVPLTLAAAWIWRKARRADISDNLRDTVLPLLQILREDFARKTQVHLRLDLGPATDPRKSKGKTEPFEHGGYYHVVDETFEDPWMSLEAVLNDGGRLTCRIEDSVRERKRRKRNPRGKIKMSTRHAKKTAVEVHLALPAAAFEVVPEASAHVKTGKKRHVVSIVRKIRAASLDPVSPTAVIDALADAYRSVRRSGAEARV